MTPQHDIPLAPDPGRPRHGTPTSRRGVAIRVTVALIAALLLWFSSSEPARILVFAVAVAWVFAFGIPALIARFRPTVGE